MHSYVYQMLVVLLIVVLLLTIAGLVFDLKLDYSYLQGIEDRGREGGWWSFILLFLKKVGHNIVLLSHAVPMSIYVAIELLKVFQKNNVQSDKGMHGVIKHGLAGEGEDLSHSVVVKDTEVLENLGQLDLVLTDKTGTLTNNNMVIRSIYCDKKIFGIQQEDEDSDGEDYNAAKAANISRESVELLTSYMEKASHDDMHDLFLCIAVCHSGKVGRDKDFVCSSEDERALLHAARKVGYSFVSRTNTVVSVRIHHQLRRYWIAAVLPFDSTRKMMSVVCYTPEGEYVMFTKGADAAVFPRLAHSEDELTTLRLRSNQFAAEGLRTLVCAARVLDEATRAQLGAFGAPGATLGGDLADEYDRLERELRFLGIVALED